MKRLLLGLCLGVMGAVAGDLFSVGVTGGVPLNDAYNAVRHGNLNYATNTKRWTAGPTIEIGLPLNFGIEIDALYRREAVQQSGTVLDLLVNHSANLNAWDFPLLLKLRLAPGPIKPFVGAGPTFRHLGGAKDLENFFTGETQNQFRTRSSNVGFTAAAGLELHAPVIRITPQLRYTRWGWQTFRDPASAFRSNSNQWDFLLGITF
jgi:hypothetical protein